ncbi:MAG: nitrilase-related carbon-nitrogen hydrolase [Bacillota bacterium]
MQKTKIALVQMQAILGRQKENLEKIKMFVEEAAENETQIICFPELAAHGYKKASFGHIAQEVSDIGQYFMQLADLHNIVILVGIAEKARCQNPYITHLIARPKKDLGVYRKTHLGSSEKPFFAQGEDLPVFTTDTSTIGVQICWDLHFPEVTTIMSLQGAEIIFAPHASPTIVGDRKKIWMKYLTARAYDNAVFVAACNLIGNNGSEQTFCGGCLVIDPRGNIVAEDFNGKESILYANLDDKIINTIRQKQGESMRHSFYLDSRRQDLYLRYLNKK